MEWLIIVVATILLIIFGMAILRLLGFILVGIVSVTTFILKIIINAIILLAGIAAILGGVTFIVKILPQFSRNDYVPTIIVGGVMIVIGIFLTKLGWVGLVGEKSSPAMAVSHQHRESSYDFEGDDSYKERWRAEADERNERENQDRERQERIERDNEYDRQQTERAERAAQEAYESDRHSRWVNEQTENSSALGSALWQLTGNTNPPDDYE